MRTKQSALRTIPASNLGRSYSLAFCMAGCSNNVIKNEAIQLPADKLPFFGYGVSYFFV